MTTLAERRSPYSYSRTPRGGGRGRKPGFGQRFLTGTGTAPNLIMQHAGIASLPTFKQGNLDHHQMAFPLSNEQVVGPIVGAGAFGTAHKAVVTPAMSVLHQRMRHEMKHGLFKEFPRVGTEVITKSQAMDQRNLTSSLKDAMKETLVHDMLSHAAPIHMGRDFAKDLRPADYVPKLYFAGMVICDKCMQMVKQRTPGGGTQKQPMFYSLAFATVMGVAPGMEVTRYLANNPRTARFYVGMERAICSMWAAGFVHADIHTSNMLYEPETKKFTIIDFGFGIQMPAAMKAEVVRKLAEGVRTGVKSLGEIFRPSTQASIGAGVQNYVNKVLRARNVSFSTQNAWHNPDGTQLISQYNALPESERAKVAAYRRQLWGAPAPAQPRRANRLAGRTTTAAPPRQRPPAPPRPAAAPWAQFMAGLKGGKKTPMLTPMNID